MTGTDRAVAPSTAPVTGGAGPTTGADLAASTGWECLNRDRAGRIGVFSNPTGVLADTRHIVDDLVRYAAIDLVAVFGPEHGFRGSAQAGGSEGADTDPRTGLPVYDAYHASIDDMARMFSEARLDTVVFDIQDIGARFYTYIWSMYQAMVAAARLGIRFVVLDRPNPIGGRVDGPMMTPAFTTFVGLKEIVQQHGMTVGELAGFFNGEFLPDEAGSAVELEVVRLRNWHPDSLAHHSGLPWIPPSPNIPTPDSALAFVGTGYFEATVLSEGRGTTRPFEWVGAPFCDRHWSERLNAYELPGVRFRETYFVPTFHKHAQQTCPGVHLHLTDPEACRPIAAAVAMLVEAMRYDGFEWRVDDYDPDRPYWIDKLAGSTQLRTMLDSGAGLEEILGAWRTEIAEFDSRRQPYLLYPGRGMGWS